MVRLPDAATGIAPWPGVGRGPARCGTAALLAALFTSMLLALLQADPHEPSTRAPEPRVWLLHPEALAAEPVARPPPADAAPPRGQREVFRQARTGPALIRATSATTGPSEAPPDAPLSAPAADRAASAAPRLRLDPQVLRNAHRASRSAVAEMAQSAEIDLDDAPVSGPQRLADDVARAAKPDCLGPGGSLLDAPTIAYRMLADTCRVR